MHLETGIQKLTEIWIKPVGFSFILPYGNKTWKTVLSVFTARFTVECFEMIISSLHTF